MGIPTSYTPLLALIDYKDLYVQPFILSALESRLPSASFTLVEDLPADLQGSRIQSVLQFRQYEEIDWDHALHHPQNSLVNAYTIRKALIRKHYLSTTVHNWIVKHPESVLRRHVKVAVAFELDYAEFLDDALNEADSYDLRDSFAKNEGKDASERDWWILKPSMSDKGQGIRLFSTEEELTAIFESWEEEGSEHLDNDSCENDGHSSEKSGLAITNGIALNGTNTDPDDANKDDEGNGVVTSQLRHFIAQPYIGRPLLLAECEDRKFHIRTYVLAVGSLRVYVYNPMLALFAANPYTPPWSTQGIHDDQEYLRTHLTNTCLQNGEREGSVKAFWDLPDENPLPSRWKSSVFSQICSTTSALFEAAARGMMTDFQTLPFAFEVFGLDFLVDADYTAWLLEVNAFPDFKQTGNALSGIIEGLFGDVVDVAVKPFFGLGAQDVEGTDRMTRVLDLDLGRR
ncbi:hypothetical protein B0A49_01508 [Cryomyces minteri]|uniref:TTL domain-containing protein n=1 Tax=Cryomyces minteri TaxID=331657 RepID=A0A4V6WL73_9PEZI|nr:hypothetical protein B0A49_01508 [Cryomyces minteri]